MELVETLLDHKNIFKKRVRKTQIFFNHNQGWINNYRKQSKRVFIDLKDGSSNEHLQVLLDRDLCKQNFGFGDAITITGEIGTAPRGHIELRAKKYEINGKSDMQHRFLHLLMHNIRFIIRYMFG